MADRKTVTTTPIIVALVIVTIPLLAYVTCYFWLGKVVNGTAVPSGAPFTIREYDGHWQVSTFAPMAWAEAKVRQRTIHVASLETGEMRTIKP
jgi:hypothetical protein